jgi:small subunit ribosomal protein S6
VRAGRTASLDRSFTSPILLPASIGSPQLRAAVRRRYEPLRPYEVMIIFDADLEEETIRSAVGRYSQLIESKGATPGFIDYWGKRRFAYPVRHKLEGYYVVLQAMAEPAAMDELHRVLSLADEVVRHKVLRIPPEVYGPPASAATESAGI